MKLKETGASMRLETILVLLIRNLKFLVVTKIMKLLKGIGIDMKLNNEYFSELEKIGLLASGTSPDGNLVEIMEVSNHPFMIGSQFHPEFLSRPDRASSIILWICFCS